MRKAQHDSPSEIEVHRMSAAAVSEAATNSFLAIVAQSALAAIPSPSRFTSESGAVGGTRTRV